MAEACPEIGFDLVGPFYPDDYAQAVLRRAQGVANVTVHGAASRDRVTVFYHNAACLCNTSDYEGFPNTFLEAWSWGLPVVSMFDPDSLLAGKNLGLAVADIPGDGQRDPFAYRLSRALGRNLPQRPPILR